MAIWLILANCQFWQFLQYLTISGKFNNFRKFGNFSNLSIWIILGGITLAIFCEVIVWKGFSGLFSFFSKYCFWKFGLKANHTCAWDFFFTLVGQCYISQKFGGGHNFSGGIFVYYCTYCICINTKYFRKTSGSSPWWVDF